MSDDPSLRPCPFCGEAVMPRDALWPSEGDQDAVIHAAPSDCPMQVFSDGTWGGSLYGRWNGGPDTASYHRTILIQALRRSLSHISDMTIRGELRDVLAKVGESSDA